MVVQFCHVPVNIPFTDFRLFQSSLHSHSICNLPQEGTKCMAQAIWCHTVLILLKFLLAQYKKTIKFQKWGYTIPRFISRNELCVSLHELQWHIYVHLYYSHVAESCKQLVLLHHPVCCATLSTVDRSQYCQSLLFSLVAFCKKNVGLWHPYAVSVLPTSTSEPGDFHYTWYEYFVIGIHRKL